MKKKLRLTVLLLAAALLLSACSMSRSELAEFLDGSTVQSRKKQAEAGRNGEAETGDAVEEHREPTGTGRDNIVPFEEIEYVRPSVAAMEARVDKIKALLAEDSDPDTVMAELDRCWEDYYTFYTMYTLAEICAYRDMTDAAWAEEYDYCDAASDDVERIIDELYIACAKSDMGERLERDYFGEGFLDYYGSDYTGLTDEAYAALLRQETALLNEYRQLRSGVTVDYRGEEVSYYDLTEDPSLSDAEYYAAVDAYYEKYTPIFGDLYIRLVKVRNELAAYCGYESYGDYAFDVLYGRDYTAEEAEALAADIRTYIAPLYEETIENGSWGRVSYDELDEDGLVRLLGAAAEEMGGDVAETWRFLDDYHLYDVKVSSKKVDMSFQDYLEDYEAPFALVKTWGSTEDLLSFAHEFGHCVDAYVNYNDTYSLELAETFSQGMEYLTLCHLDGAANAETVENLTRMKLLDTLDTYAQQGSFADFEQQVYSLPEEKLTVENINAISLQTAKDYGYFEAGSEDYYAMSWIDITHFFEQPWYVISYCVSNDAAFQIYQAELAEPGEGLALYEAILPRESDEFLVTIEEQGAMESPFAPGRMESTAELIREALD